MKLALTSLLVFSLVAYQAITGHSNFSKVRSEIETDLTQEGSARPSEPSLSQTMLIAVETESNRGKDPSGVVAAKNVADQYDLKEKEKNVSSALGSDAEGLEVKRFYVASIYQDQIPASKRLLASMAAEWASEGKDGFSKLRTALDRVRQSEYPGEGMRILGNLQEYSQADTLVKDLAKSEFTRNQGTPTAAERNLDRLVENPNSEVTANDPEYLRKLAQVSTEAVAHRVFLGKAQDSEEALQATVQGINACDRKGLRILLARQFLSQYPDMQASLYSSVTP